MTKECTECKKNGHTGIMVNWKALEKDSSGKVTKWQALNPDGSEHYHKQKGDATTSSSNQDWQKQQNEKNEQIKAMHEANLKQSKELVDAIKDLASAIRTSRFTISPPSKEEEEGPEEEEEGGPT